MSKELLEKIKNLSINNKDVELKKLLEQELQKDPSNCELLLRLALVELWPPFADESRSKAILNKLLNYDSNNTKAIILLAYIQWFEGCMDEELLKRLLSVDSENKELQSMIEYSKALYYQINKNDEKYEKYLLKSIELCQQHVWNHVELGKLYLKVGKISEGKKLLQKAIQNVKVRYDEKNLIDYDSSDIDNFLDSQIKGVAIADVLYLEIQNDLFKK